MIIDLALYTKYDTFILVTASFSGIMLTSKGRSTLISLDSSTRKCHLTLIEVPVWNLCCEGMRIRSSQGLCLSQGSKSREYSDRSIINLTVMFGNVVTVF